VWRQSLLRHCDSCAYLQDVSSTLVMEAPRDAGSFQHDNVHVHVEDIEASVQVLISLPATLRPGIQMDLLPQVVSWLLLDSRETVVQDTVGCTAAPATAKVLCRYCWQAHASLQHAGNCR
jgi:hypothetical protein